MKIRAILDYIIARLTVSCRRCFRIQNLFEDALPASRIPSVSLGDSRDRVLAVIDRDGFLFALDDRDRPLFNTRNTMSERASHRIEIILRAGDVLLRKTVLRQKQAGIKRRIFEFLQWEFFIEAAALLHLRGLSCVPTIRRWDTHAGAIEMDYVWGQDLRQILAKGSHEIAYDENFRLFSELVSLGDKDDTCRQLMGIVTSVVHRGIVPRDVHAANFIVGRQSNKLYMVDFGLVSFCLVPGCRWHVSELEWLLKTLGG